MLAISSLVELNRFGKTRALFYRAVHITLFFPVEFKSEKKKCCRKDLLLGRQGLLLRHRCAAAASLIYQVVLLAFSASSVVLEVFIL